MGGNFLGMSFPGGNFPDTICNYLEYCPWLTLYNQLGAENKLLDLHKLVFTNFKKQIFEKKKSDYQAALDESSSL